MKNTVNINLDRKQVILMLQEKKMDLDRQLLQAIAEEVKYNEQVEAWKQKVADKLVTSLVDGSSWVEDMLYARVVRIETSFELPSKPRSQSDSRNTVYHYKTTIKQIESTLALLEICTDTTIKSKSYGDILSLLS